MRYFLPIIIIACIFITGCSKDKNISNEMAQKEKSIADSLYSIYGVRFSKPSELNITGSRPYNFPSSMHCFWGFRNGNPWIAFYNNSKKLLKEHSEALPDSIKADKSLNQVVESSFSSYITKDIILVTGIIREGIEPTIPTGKIAAYMYRYDIKDNTIKRRIYDYGYLSEITLYDRFKGWYNGSFLVRNWEEKEYFIIDRNLEELSRYKNSSIPGEGTYFFSNDVWGAYAVSMDEYLTTRITETTLEIHRWSTSALLVTPEYPELPYYSYLKEKIEVEIIERPNNFRRLVTARWETEDLGNELEITLSGIALLYDEKNYTEYEKQVKGKVLVDKKTGGIIGKRINIPL